MKNSLHMIRLSPFKESLSHISTLITENDAIVLIDDGCYCLSHPSLNDLQTKSTNIFIVEEHARARTIAITNNMTVIQSSELPSLSIQYKNVVTWQ